MSAQDTALATTYDEFSDWEEAPSGAQYQKMKEIRFCGELSKRARQEGIPVGNFYLFDANVAQGEDPILTDLGDKVKVNVIRDTKRLEVYEEFDGKQRFTVTSSEFRDNDDLIFLYDCTITDGNNELVACLPYVNLAQAELSIKHLKDTRYGGKLRTRYLAYCLWYPEEGQTEEGKPEVVQIGFTATDNTGCKDGEFAPRGFNDYSEDSFLGLKHGANKIKANMLFVQDVEIYSKPAYTFKDKKSGEEKESIDRIKGFRIIGQIGDDRKELVKEALLFVRQYLQSKYQAKTLKAYANTIEKEDIITLDERYIPLLIGKPELLLGYERLPAIGKAEIPQLDLPESSRGSEPQKDRLPFDEPSKPEIVDAKKVENTKKLSRDERLAEKRELEANPYDTSDVERLHEDTKAAQAEKLKEVNDVFGE